MYLYLACPYTHPNSETMHYRFEQANHAAASLMKQGWVVYSPISHSHIIAQNHDLPTGWDFWRNIDRVFITHASFLAVLVLNGWKESIGVREEMLLARELNKPIVLLDPKTHKFSAPRIR